MPGASAPGYQRFAALRLFGNGSVTSRSDSRLIASCVSARNSTIPLPWSTSGASLLEIVIVNTLYMNLVREKSPGSLAVRSSREE
ncbi:MAG: hypothetical protein KDD67_17150 [Ignavibacteriae bacterium]|nr:hypothetical protein [Ignavibacteriota bacterium]MCB9214263.1 hypothetical protein [Ignavibacteria bacterium]